jgi:thiol-disulfide isomerase/thioredoxin
MAAKEAACGPSAQAALMQKTVLEISMKIMFAFLTTALILLTAPAMAGEQPYDAATLQKMLAAGQPVVVDFHADWCPTCRAQAPIVKDLLATPELKNVTVLIANYDTELALRKSLKVANQSTLVVFRQGKEVARSTGDTSRDGLAALLHKATS